MSSQKTKGHYAMRFTYNNIFMNTNDETTWLNTMTKRGLHLVKRLPFTYYFEFVDDLDTEYNYKIVYMHDAIENSASDEEIKNIPDDGSVLVCGYKNKAYYKKAGGVPLIEYNDSNARYTHFLNIWLFYAFLFVASISVFAYHLVFAIRMLLEEKPLPSVPVIAATIIVLICVSVLFAYYGDKVMFWKKKSKEATLLKIQNDQI